MDSIQILSKGASQLFVMIFTGCAMTFVQEISAYKVSMGH